MLCWSTSSDSECESERALCAVVACSISRAGGLGSLNTAIELVCESTEDSASLVDVMRTVLGDFRGPELLRSTKSELNTAFDAELKEMSPVMGDSRGTGPS